MGKTEEKEYLPPSSLCHFKIFNGFNTGLFTFVNDSSNEKIRITVRENFGKTRQQ
jgi:hypothetical protein